MKLERVHRVVSSTLGELPLQEGGSTFKPAGVKRETKAEIDIVYNSAKSPKL